MEYINKEEVINLIEKYIYSESDQNDFIRDLNWLDSIKYEDDDCK